MKKLNELKSWFSTGLKAMFGWEKFLVVYLVCASIFGLGSVVYNLVIGDTENAAIGAVISIVMLALLSLYINSAPARKLKRQKTAHKVKETAQAAAAKYEEAKLNKKDPTVLQTLTELSALHEKGELSDEEYNAKKTELLRKI